MTLTLPSVHVFGLRPHLACPALANYTRRLASPSAERRNSTDMSREDIGAPDVAIPSLPDWVEPALWTELFDAVNARIAAIVPRAECLTYKPLLPINESGREALQECADACEQLKTLFPVANPELMRARRDLLSARIAFTHSLAAICESYR